MKILLIEPYYTGSHKAWADSLKKYSSHEISLLTMPGRFWKWRMHGGAITLARKYNTKKIIPDLILATDMLNLNSFLALTRKRTSHLSSALYFHENQLSYPWQANDRDLAKGRDRHYCFINYLSAYTADRIFFNSAYHMKSFFKGLKSFLENFPDNNELRTIEEIYKKSQVLHLGLALEKSTVGKTRRKRKKCPLLLWNHRWEHDKNPEQFIEALIKLKKMNIDFEVVFLGESFNRTPAIFRKAKQELKKKILHFGYLKNRSEYISWLEKADILPVTSRQDFFGASVVEAIHHGCIPLLPTRLAYPELISPAKHPELFYSQKKEFLPKLKKIILDKERFTAPKSEIAKYDFQTMIKKYDEAFKKTGHCSSR